MHTNQTYNFLVADNPKFPFPKEIQEYLVGYPFEQVTWNSLGLPAFQCTFSLTGDQLYFEKDAKDNVKLRKENFTGQALVSGVLTPEGCDEVFFLNFELNFCDGILNKAELIGFKKEARVDYDAGFKKFCANMERNSRIRKSWWFKWLYVPYYYILTIPTMIIFALLKFLAHGLVWTVGKFLPIKL